MIPSLKVLLVDDSRAERELASEAAKEFGPDITFLAVGTPDEAQRECEIFAPELIIIDLHMGRWHGRDLLPILRGSIGTLILTNAEDPIEAVRCLAAGALGFWTKPMHFDGFADLFDRLRCLAAPSRSAPSMPALS